MKSLPKWVGWLSILAGAATAGGAMNGIVSPKVGAIAAFVATVLANLSHSLPGTGGTDANP